MTLTAGLVIADRFKLKRLVGVGGTGWVWEARDLRTREFVALKILRREVVEDLVTQARFRREADTVAALDHPGIARFVDYGHFADDVQLPGQTITYLATEFVRGEGLDALIRRRRRLPAEQALTILEATSRALGHAHAAGVIHRDVKPGNILVAKDGTAKLTDFGIVRISGENTLTGAGSVMGTALYASPEQVRGDDPTAASDVYSLAVVGYEMLSGRRLFTGEGPIALATSHLEQEPDPLPDDVDPRVRALIARALRKDPRQRPQNGAEFADEIAAARRAVLDDRDGAQTPNGTTGLDSPPAAVPVTGRLRRRLRTLRRR